MQIQCIFLCNFYSHLSRKWVQLTRKPSKGFVAKLAEQKANTSGISGLLLIPILEKENLHSLLRLTSKQAELQYTYLISIGGSNNWADFIVFLSQAFRLFAKATSPYGIQITSINFMPCIQMQCLISCPKFYSSLCELHSAPRQGIAEELTA